MRLKLPGFISLLPFMLVTSCLDHRELASLSQLRVQDFASRLAAPNRFRGRKHLLHQQFSRGHGAENHVLTGQGADTTLRAT